MLYKSSPARRSIMGNEQTRNPPLAAYSILNRALGKKRVAAGVRRASGRRGFGGILGRRKHRNNPLPAVAGLLGSSLLGGLGKRFKAPSEKRAARIAPSIVAAANAGNLVAAKGLIERAAMPMKRAEEIVWDKALAQLSPKIIAAVTRYAERLPSASQANPEEFAASLAAAPVVDLAQLETQEREEANQRRAGAAAVARERAEAGERREARLLDVGGQIGAAVLGRGRSPKRRRKKPKKRRAFSV
jgi:hypothetical protein